MSAGRWGVGLGATAVLVATGVWVLWPADVDAHLWSEVRPVIEARLVAESEGGGYGETRPGLEARWFCRAEAVDLAEHDGLVRAGVTTLCLEYGARGGALMECSGSEVPQVVRLERDAGGGYRVVSWEEPPDGAGYARWLEEHFSRFARSDLDDTVAPTALQAAARDHFGLAADAPVRDC